MYLSLLQLRGLITKMYSHRHTVTKNQLSGITMHETRTCTLSQEASHSELPGFYQGVMKRRGEIECLCGLHFACPHVNMLTLMPPLQVLSASRE